MMAEEGLQDVFCNRVFKRLARAVFVLEVTRAAELTKEEAPEERAPEEEAAEESVLLFPVGLLDIEETALLTLLRVPDFGDDRFDDEFRFSPLLGLLAGPR